MTVTTPAPNAALGLQGGDHGGDGLGILHGLRGELNLGVGDAGIGRVPEGEGAVRAVLQFGRARGDGVGVEHADVDRGARAADVAQRVLVEVDGVVDSTRIGITHDDGDVLGLLRSANTDVLDHQVGAAVVVFVDVGAGHALGVDNARAGDIVVARVGLIVLDAENGGLDTVGARSGAAVNAAVNVGEQGIVSGAAVDDVAGVQRVAALLVGVEGIRAGGAGQVVEAGGQVECDAGGQIGEGTVVDAGRGQAVLDGVGNTGFEGGGSSAVRRVRREAGVEVHDIHDDCTALAGGNAVETPFDVGDGIGVGLAREAGVVGDDLGDLRRGLGAKIGGEDVIGDGIEAADIDFRDRGVVSAVVQGNTVQRAHEAGDLGRGERDSH